jgi:hypothetical protein
MGTFRLIAALGLAASSAPAWAQLAYAELSTGLNTLAWDGGRTVLRLADLDADGHQDLLTVGDHGSPYINTQMHGVTVWFGDGANHWSLFQYGNFGYGGVVVGDANNDGLADVAYGIHHNYSGVDLGNQVLEVALGDGTGRVWTAWDDGLATDGQNWGMFGTEFADFDADGWLDVGSVSFGADDGVWVYRNDRDGSWTRTFGFAGGNCTMDTDIGDVNNDGAPDFITAHQSGTVWLGDGAGGFVLGDANLPSGGSSGRRRPSVGDVDRDGRDDLAFATSAGGAQVWRSLPGGTWQSISGSLPASGTIDATLLVDMDADGLLDLVTFGDAAGKVWKGDGASGWAQAAEFRTPAAGEYAGLTTGDADHNGRPDIAVVSREGNWPSDYNHLHLFTETSVATEPSVLVTRPPANRVLRAGSVLFVDWLGAVPPGDVGTATIELRRDGGPWRTLASGVPNSGRHQLTLDALLPGPGVELRVRLTTGSHAEAEGLTGPLTIVGSSCPADFSEDGSVNTLDVLAFLNAWAAGDARADFNADGSINTLDVLAFLNAWGAGCV